MKNFISISPVKKKKTSILGCKLLKMSLKVWPRTICFRDRRSELRSQISSHGIHEKSSIHERGMELIVLYTVLEFFYSVCTALRRLHTNGDRGPTRIQSDNLRAMTQQHEPLHNLISTWFNILPVIKFISLSQHRFPGFSFEAR